MRLPLIVSSILSWVVLNPTAHAVSGQADKLHKLRRTDLNIRVEEGSGWGGASNEEIESVLYAVAEELATPVPIDLPISVVVTHTDREPMVLYEKASGGEYQIRLHAKDQRWGEYVYEFAHELCHIMTNYDAYLGHDSRNYNQWFEETLCETAALYALRSMATKWEYAPPRPGLEKHAKKMNAFAQRLVMEGHRNLPEGTPLAEWLRKNEKAMRNDPYQREKNELVAKFLLPLFEKDPENMDSLYYLNLDPDEAKTDFQQYLHAWYDNAPLRHKVFVGSVLKLLGVEVPKEMFASHDPALSAGAGSGNASVSQPEPGTH